jgi:hypothetical protein
MMTNEPLTQVNTLFQVCLFVKSNKHSGKNDVKRIFKELDVLSFHFDQGQSDESHHNGPTQSSNTMMNSTKSANVIVQENRQKAAKMLIAVVIIFTICYIPVHAFNLFR